MMQSMYSQIIPTKEQQKKIKELTTPERLIEYSKGLSNEKSLAKRYDSLVKLISKKDKLIDSLLVSHKADLLKIALSNNQVNQIESTIDEIDKDLKPGFFKSKFHFYGSLEVPQLNFQNTIISTELMLDLKILEIGSVLSAFPIKNKLEFNYGIKLRYKFF